jgi:hypothetical protein
MLIKQGYITPSDFWLQSISKCAATAEFYIIKFGKRYSYLLLDECKLPY